MSSLLNLFFWKIYKNLTVALRIFSSYTYIHKINLSLMKMPAVHSKVSLDAKKATLEESSRTNKRFQNTPNNGRVTQATRRNEVVPELDLKSTRPIHKLERSQKPNERRTTQKLSASTTVATKKTKKRQVHLENAKQKLGLSEDKSLEKSENSNVEKLKSRGSLYFTPRQEALDASYDFQNYNPEELPDNFYENELDSFIRTQYPDFEDISKYDIDAPFVLEDMCLLSGRSKYSETLPHFKELLNMEEKSGCRMLNQGELGFLKEVVKENDHQSKFHKEDYDLLKEILLGQLKEIAEQERVIKIALKKIALKKIRPLENLKVKIDSKNVEKAEQPLEKDLESIKFRKATSAGCSSTRQEVDVFFKNIPSLEKEIEILKSLGTKLEKTMKPHTEEPTPAALCVHKVCFTSFNYSWGIATSKVVCQGIKVNVGRAEEFEISHQTIDELKLENREFYIAADVDRFTLSRTSFEKLRRNPELLLRKLKPFTKDSRLKFNFIEQDPMFFNYFLSKMCNISLDGTDTCGKYIPKHGHVHCIGGNHEREKIAPMSGGGDFSDFAVQKDKTTQVPKIEYEQPSFETKIKSRSSFERKKIKRSRTPMPQNVVVIPKNNLVKTVLLSVVQLTIIFTLLSFIAAIFYPEIVCI